MLKQNSIYALLFSANLFLIGQYSFAQGISISEATDSLSEARQLCKSLNASDLSLAKSAGYDVGKLCKSIEQVNLPESLNDIRPISPREVDKKEVRSPPPTLQVGGASLNSLKAFGYDLFAGEPASFEPDAHIPIPPNYTLGPGDSVRVLFYGKVNESYELKINRDGFIKFPQLGPVSLAGMTFSDAKQLLNRRIKEEIIGVEASITLGELRSIQVFMLGEVYKPGSYTISALSTITNALFLSGGVSDIASLRNIELKRSGNVIKNLDLYDLLLHGDTRDDSQLQSGDTIYIPTVKRTASIRGEVRRPAIYEIREKVTARELVELAGGLKPKAFSKSARIHRIGNSGFMNVVDIDLSTKKGGDTLIHSGDLLVVDGTVEEQEMVVSLSGHVHYPGDFLWREGMRVVDLVKNVESLKTNADLDFAIIRRELPPVGRIKTLFVDLAEAIADKDSKANMMLQPRDNLIVFSNEIDRAEKLNELVELLKLQSRSGEMTKVVTINGTVRSPGEYPLTENMTLTQLIAAAGGLKEEAYTQVVELSRHDFADIEKVEADHHTITLAESYRDPDKDLTLQPYDVISVRTIPDFKKSLNVKISGEVRFPGSYTFKRGETLSEVIKRAGGFTELAHIQASVFTREGLREQEISRLTELRQRLRTDLAAKDLEKVNDGKSSTSEESQKILDELKVSDALGRLVIDLESIINKTVNDIVLKDGDQLVIPEFNQEISVLGEVQRPSSHMHNRDFTLDDYIDLSGGVTRNADNKSIYIVKANGSVSSGHSKWFKFRTSTIEPGDTVIVPINIDRRDSLSLWREASSVVYQLALGAAAIKSF